MPTEPTAAQVRPILAARAFVFSGVLQVLDFRKPLVEGLMPQSCNCEEVLTLFFIRYILGSQVWLQTSPLGKFGVGVAIYTIPG